jgi:LSM domain
MVKVADLFRSQSQRHLVTHAQPNVRCAFIRFQTCWQMKDGEIYRGLLLSAEDTMNMTLSDVLRTARNGQVSKLPSVYLRGSSIRFIALPDLLKNAPVFQKVANMKRKMEQDQKTRQQGTVECRVRRQPVYYYFYKMNHMTHNQYILLCYWQTRIFPGHKRKRGD